MGRFEIDGERFLCNGKPFRILSGAIHYFRVVPGYWKDRLQKLAACGLNTVETVVPWNVHEPEQGKFNFHGIADLESFIRLAGSLGLKVILRLSPYVCTEWDFGGMPAWLLNLPDIAFRCKNHSFLSCVRSYYDELFSRIRSLLWHNGGPVIALQVENEYGSYGDDREYLAWLRDAMRERGGDTLLFTSDGPIDEMLANGTLPDVLKTVNFGSGWRDAFRKLGEYQTGKPGMCMEFWNGWFDHWGNSHITRESDDAARELGEMLDEGLSVNLYMFHGGTNFGFFNGANCEKKYEPDVTSYDYDAPVSEEGDLTPKYYLFQKALLKCDGSESAPLPSPVSKKDYGLIPLNRREGLFHCLRSISVPHWNSNTLPMEKLGQSFGFILYRTRVSGPRKTCNLEIKGFVTGH